MTIHTPKPGRWSARAVQWAAAILPVDQRNVRLLRHEDRGERYSGFVSGGSGNPGGGM